MKLLLCLVLLALVAGSHALPSDLIQTGPHPAVISLSGATPASAKSIDALNQNLTGYKGWQLPNVGHYSTWATATQDEPAGVPTSLLNFSSAIPKNLSDTSVGAANGNFTEINGTMVWT